MQRRPLKGWLKKLAHGLALIAGWLLFFGFWWHVLTTQSISHREIVLLIAGSLILFPLLTLYWVLHNRAIYKAKGPRRQVRVVAEHYPCDWEGRNMLGEWSVLKSARSIVVMVDSENKVYQGTPSLASGPRSAVPDPSLSWSIPSKRSIGDN